MNKVTAVVVRVCAYFAVFSLLFIALVGCSSDGGMPVQVSENSSASNSQDSPASYSQDTPETHLGLCDSTTVGTQFQSETSIITVYTCAKCCGGEDPECFDSTSIPFYKWVVNDRIDWECKSRPAGLPASFLSNPSSSSFSSTSQWIPSSSSDGMFSSSSIERNSSSVQTLWAQPCNVNGENNCEFIPMIDPRDGKTYMTIIIGTQTWMAQNLNYETANSECYKDRYHDDCATYGRLYTGAEMYTETPMLLIQDVCPEGWHLPSRTEWETLIVTVDTSLHIMGYSKYNGAGNKLKHKDSGWTYGTDDFGFWAMSEGHRGVTGYFEYYGSATFWSSTVEANRYNVYGSYCMNLTEGSAATLDWTRIEEKHSVRCVKD